MEGNCTDEANALAIRTLLYYIVILKGVMISW